MATEKKLTVKETINRFGITKSTVYNWINAGKLRSTKEYNRTLILLSKDEEENLDNEITLIKESRSPKKSINEDQKNSKEVHEIPLNGLEESGLVQQNVNGLQYNPVESLTQSIDKLTEKLGQSYKEHHQELNQVHLNYRNELLNMNKKVLLLEDLEKRKEDTCIQVQSENKQLKSLLQEKENQIRELELTLQEKEKSIWKKPLSEVLKKL